MKKSLLIVWLPVLVAGSILIGCAPTKIAVDRSSEAELQAVSTYAAAREDYRHGLSVLEAYYTRNGNLDRLRWARREIQNLDEASSELQWSWMPQIVPPEGAPVVNRDERVLVERAVVARNAYLKAVEELDAWYKSSGQTAKRSALAKMRKSFNPIHTYDYYLDAEIPGPELRPTVVYAQADALFEEAMALYHSGKGLLGVAMDEQKEIQALNKFRKLVWDYPDSTKIALSAYFIGEIYKEYFKENVRAVYWYERAWQWDPRIEEPARFQAATVYDMRLQNYPKAIELYRESIKYDPYRWANDNFARGRIAELTNPGKKKK